MYFDTFAVLFFLLVDGNFLFCGVKSFGLLLLTNTLFVTNIRKVYRHKEYRQLSQNILIHFDTIEQTKNCVYATIRRIAKSKENNNYSVEKNWFGLTGNQCHVCICKFIIVG